MTTTPAAPSSPIAYLIRGLIYKAFLLAIWLLSAGRWDWFWAWLYIAIFVIFDILTVLLVDPGLLAERTRRSADQKSWDKLYVGLGAGLLPILSGVVAGLDLRFGWLPDVSALAQWIAAAVVALGYGITLWSMWANAYFSAIVRIQTDRGHQVATGGPYRIVRHPGYVGAILFTLAMPVMFGSIWGVIPAVLAAILFIIRTRKEDDTLQAELPGYREFSQQTRFRLIPGLW